MASARRIEKLQMLLRDELARIIDRECDFPDRRMITITHVTISSDARYATVFLSVLGGDPKAAATTLTQEVWRIQQMLNKRLRMRPVPQIRFTVDAGEIKREAVEKSLVFLSKEERE